MQTFDTTVRNATHWVRITRDSNKAFTFAYGFKGQFKAHRISTVGKEFMGTIKEAKEHAAYMLAND